MANDILFNPEGTIALVERTYEDQASTSRGEQTAFDNELARAQLERVSQDVREKATRFEERESLLRDRFENVIDD